MNARLAAFSVTLATVLVMGAWALVPVLDRAQKPAPVPTPRHTPQAQVVVAAPRGPGPLGSLVPVSSAFQVPGSGVGPGQKLIALTFDDGPDPIYTPQVLAALKGAGVTATFFMLGWEANTYPDIVRQVASAGNGIGNHTWNHVDLTTLSPAAVPDQVDRTTHLLAALSGRTVSCLRPPQGHLNAVVESELASRRLTTVLWDDDPRDWTRPGTATIVHRVLSEAKPGAIVEMHDGGGDRSETVQALPVIIAALRAEGYQFVPLCR